MRGWGSLAPQRNEQKVRQGTSIDPLSAATNFFSAVFSTLP